jgi:putative endonuclease
MPSSRNYYVYILASQKNGTLYLGVTSDLVKRIYEHKNDLVGGFTKKYKVHRLVYFETTNDVYGAIQREKQLKKWNRQWKIRLIEEKNPPGAIYTMNCFSPSWYCLDSRLRGNDKEKTGMTKRKNGNDRRGAGMTLRKQ